MIITISGMPGSGKSTVAKRLSRALNYRRYYMGDVRRKMAKQIGLTLEEFNKKGETDPLTDTVVEEYVKKLGRTENNFVIESRTAWHFIPRAIHIFIYVDIQEGARRVFKSLHNPKSKRARNEGSHLNTLHDVARSLTERVASDELRYKKYYGLDIWNKKNYDLYLDATHLSQNEEYRAVESFVRARLAHAY